MVPVPQRCEPGAGPGRAAAHRPAARRLPAPAPARPARHRRRRVDHLGRQRPRLQRAARHHRGGGPARPAAAPGRRLGGPAGAARRVGGHGVERPGRHLAPPRQRRLAGRLRLPDVAQPPERLPGRRGLRAVRPGAAAPRPRRRRDGVHRGHPGGARRRLGGAAAAPARHTAAGRSRCAATPPVGPRQPPRRRPRLHRHPAGHRRPVDLHPHARPRAPRPALGGGAPRRGWLAARGRRRGAAAHRLRRRASGRMPPPHPGWPAAAGWPRTSSRRPSSRTRPRTRCCCAARTAWSRRAGAAPRCTARAWPGCGHHAADAPTGGRLVPCTR